MRNESKSCSWRRKRRIVNVVELSCGELVYIRLDDGKKYLLDCSGCWRCGSTANCFGNMTDNARLDVICEFDFFREVRSLFLCLLRDRVIRIADWLIEKASGRVYIYIDNLVDVFARTVECVNLRM